MAKNRMSPCPSLGERANSRKMLPTSSGHCFQLFHYSPIWARHAETIMGGQNSGPVFGPRYNALLTWPLPAEHDHETSSHDPFNMDPTTLEQLFLVGPIKMVMFI